MDEKKKTIIVIALGIVVLGVGAFQFSSISGPKENTAVKAKADKEKEQDTLKQQKLEAEQKAVPNPLFANALVERDPFSPGVLNAVVDDRLTPATTNEQRPPKAESYSKVPPFNPEISGPLPGATPSGNIGIGASTKLRQPDEFTYTLKGILLGDRPAAVFQTDDGNQILVGLGGSINGEARVTSIADKVVTVRHKGKTVTLTVGAKK